MKQLFLLFILIISTQQVLTAQYPVESEALEYLQGNEVKAAFRNGGDFFWDGTRNAQYQVPYQSNNTPNSIFAAALWMGGYDEGNNLRVAAQTYRSSGNDYWAGPLNDTTGTIDSITSRNFDRIWKVNKTNIHTLLLDFADGTIDNTPDSSLLIWPAKGNPHFQAIMGFVLPNKDLAPFFDQNNDGNYNPYDGDYPTYEQNLANAFANEMLWSVFNDHGNGNDNNSGTGNVHTQSDGVPLKVEVHQLALAFDCPNDSLISRTIFTRHKIIAKDSQTIHNFKLGIWLDLELGCFNDDYVGTAPDLNTIYCYNSNNTDSCSSSFGKGYGNNPPVQAISFLNHNLTKSIYGNIPGPIGDPTSPLHYYRGLSGIFSDGTPLTYGNTGYNSSGGTPTDYLFPSNPNDSSGWSMVTENLVGSDLKIIGAIAKDSLVQGETFTVDIAYSYHRDLDSNHLQNVNLMYNQVPKIQDYYNQNFSCSIVNAVKETKLSTSTINNNFKVYPNPSTDKIYVELGEQMVQSVSLYSLLGQELQQQRNATGIIEFQRGNLVDGIYLIQIQTAQGILSKKVHFK